MHAYRRSIVYEHDERRQRDDRHKEVENFYIFNRQRERERQMKFNLKPSARGFYHYTSPRFIFSHSYYLNESLKMDNNFICINDFLPSSTQYSHVLSFTDNLSYLIIYNTLTQTTPYYYTLYTKQYRTTTATTTSADEKDGQALRPRQANNNGNSSLVVG